jgi:hypothetical protein
MADSTTLDNRVFVERHVIRVVLERGQEAEVIVRREEPVEKVGFANRLFLL